jgi:aminomethyltransferase
MAVADNAEPDAAGPPARTPLYHCHVTLGARMVPFAGYEMPVQYADGVLKEHLWTREKAGLFDVAHMGIAYLEAADNSHETMARALETLVPADILNLAPGRQRYTQFLNMDGGIIDDLMVARSADPAHEGWLYLVVNAARKAVDFALLDENLPEGVKLHRSDQFALVALQGPAAEDVIARFDPAVREMSFMGAGRVTIDGVAIHLTRSGYTGEDGFELPLPVADATRLWNLLLEDDRVRPIGLGARDSLRLEAGLCLYGHDIDENTSPIEAGLAWSIQKRRREEGGFPGAERIQRELKDGPTRRRVGLTPTGRAPAREGTPIHNPAGGPVGAITSGGFGPSVGAPIAMGYVPTELAKPGTPLDLIVRGKPLPAEVVKLPFIEPSYKR